MATGQPTRITIARSRSASSSTSVSQTSDMTSQSTQSDKSQRRKEPMTKEEEREEKIRKKEEKKLKKEEKKLRKEEKRAEKKQKREDKKQERKDKKQERKEKMEQRKEKIKSKTKQGKRDKDAPPEKKEPDDGVPRIEVLARPTSRRLRSLWDEKAGMLTPERRDKIKSALEEEYFLSPEQTEQYFQAMGQDKLWSSPGNATTETRDTRERLVQMKQRQKWLVEFSAQVAYHICDYLAKGEDETLVSNRLRSIADVVLERVAEILGERKPSRNNGGRLARFMIAISDRIAVWIEAAVYRAEVLDDEVASCDGCDHVRNDREVVA